MIDCKSRPVIFPRLARKLVVSDGRMMLSGRKRADFKLLELIASFDDLPHVMVWNTNAKYWEAYPDGSVLQIMDDVIVNYDYEKLCQFEPAMLISWLNLYSSASFTLIDVRGEATCSSN